MKYFLISSASFLLAVNGCNSSSISNKPQIDADTRVVAPNGSDSNPGTLEQPFQTIAKCASVAQAGMTCAIRAGTYRETVRPVNSGSSDAPITFQAYNNETVLISGADVVSQWQVHSGNVFKTNIAWNLGEGRNQVFQNAKMQLEARYPNSSNDLLRPTLGRVRGASGAGDTWTIQADNVPANIVGAKINIVPGPIWVAETGVITASSSTGFTFQSKGGQIIDNPPWAPTLFHPKDNNPYFIWGTLELLDSPGEWVLKDGVLYLWSDADPNSQTIEVKRRDYAFDLRDRSNIKLQGLQIFAATITTGDPTNPNASTSSNVALDGVHVRYPSHYTFVKPGTSWEVGIKDSGVLLYGSNHSLRNSSVAFSAGNGVALAGAGHLLENNVIRDVDYTITDACAISAGWYGIDSKDHIIKKNTAFNAARSMIVHRNSQNIKILNNHLYNTGLLADDLGFTYTYESDGAGTEIAYNVVHDNFAEGYNSGIYLDNGSKNHTVHHNIVYNVNTALNLNLPSIGNKIHNNTLLAWENAYGGGAPYAADFQVDGTELINNLYGARMQGIVPPWDGSSSPIKKYAREENNLPSEKNPRFANPLENEYGLGDGSPAIDAGQVIPGVTDGFTGNAPDIGALERGKPMFQVGASLQVPCVYGDDCTAKPTVIYGLNAEYFNDENLETTLLKRLESQINLSATEDAAFANAYLAAGKNFSARLTGMIQAPVSGTYTFDLTADDGAKLWIDNQLLVDRWAYRSPPVDQFTLTLQAGRKYAIKLEFRQGTGGASAQLEWAYPGQLKQIVPRSRFTTK
jgi:PA14 domain/Right handed beta helix region